MRRLILLFAIPLLLLPGYAQTSTSLASPYVPIESWIYPAIERLAAAGYVQTAFAGLRPWTRMECARLLDEAREQQSELGPDEKVDAASALLMRDLGREFALELRQQDGLMRERQGAIESIDFRSSSIAGAPTADGYHFAQTLTNDYGRPYGEGENVYTGVTLRASSGPFASFFRAELQNTAPGRLAPASSQAAIATVDFTTTAALGPQSGFTRGRVSEGYGSFAFRNNQISFGKQALWWGPGKGGPMLFSNNAEPLLMLRLDRVSPFELPSFGRLLGPIRFQAFIGRLSGQQFVHVVDQTFGTPGAALGDQPFIHGEKVSFKPSPNFEFSVSRTAIFAGTGSPFTAASLARSFFSYSNTAGKNDPGDRRSAVDMQYRVPGVRNWLTAYVDTFTDDEPFPLNYPTKSAWSPGVYLAKVPGLPHMDLRAEGFLTPHRDEFPGYYYFNVHYLSGYTSQRQLLGSWIGRESNGFQVWSHWWFSSRTSVEASIRHQSAASEFLRGGDLRDIDFSADVALHPDWQLHVTAQQERWRFPLFASSVTNNFTTTVQLSYRPKAKEL
jgi:Capsule assembly protein Wzi